MVFMPFYCLDYDMDLDLLEVYSMNPQGEKKPDRQCGYPFTACNSAKNHAKDCPVNSKGEKKRKPSTLESVLLTEVLMTKGKHRHRYDRCLFKQKHKHCLTSGQLCKCGKRKP